MKLSMVNIFSARLVVLLMFHGCVCRVSHRCPSPRPPTNGHIVYHNGESSYVMYKCARGYAMRGSRSSLCMLGRWSPDPPKCVPYDRGSEPGVSTKVMPPSQPLTACPYGNKVNCSVEVKRRSVPRQDSQDCRIPQPIGEGLVIVLRETPGYVTYQCKFGYHDAHKFTVIHCKNGKWTGQPPHCLDAEGFSAVHNISQPQAKNHCEDDNGGCDQYCYFDGKRTDCSCKRGYSVNGTKCIDINECQAPENTCKGQCINTEGSFRCVCPDGYKLDKDGKSCIDINECAVYNGGCKLRCENTFGSFRCHCDFPGYTLAADGTSCVDNRGRDYCAEHNGGCSHKCHSGDSAAICSCPKGLQLSRDRKHCEDVDECSENKYGCAHRCVNLLGSAYCECHKGYRRLADGKNCEDIDECSYPEVKAECTRGCWNTNGSYVCHKKPDAMSTTRQTFATEDEAEGSGYDDYGYDGVELDPIPSAACPSGFARNESGCIDTDECEEQPSLCSHGCENTPGSFRCICPEGYALNRNGTVCTDYDECTWSPCPYACENTAGSYECTCPAGYRAHGNGINCTDIDECIEQPSLCASECQNTPGSYRCICPAGYQQLHNQTNCEDIDECSENPAPCLQTCTNTAGSYKCACQRGYRLLDNGKDCADIDECATGKPCSDVCVNTRGSFHCVCRPGRVPVGYGQRYCQDCPRNTFKNDAFGQCDKCPPHSHTNGTGKASKEDCACNAGYRRGLVGGEWCVDVDECAEKTLNCSHDCINVVGSAFCSCPLGFKLMADNLTCVDSNECEDNPRICSQLCTNTQGSYKCSCKPGYTLSANDSFQCTDNDECALGIHTCSHICVNIEGGYYCQCPKGYKITGDLKTCSAVTCPMFIEASNSVTTCNPPAEDSSASIGTRCNVRCHAGFALEGSIVTKCTKQGTWTHAPPTCKGLSCPALQHPVNGKVMPERCLSPGANYLKSRCYFHCNPGFRLQGKLVNTCEVNRTSGSTKALDWKHLPGTCKKETGPVRITCPSSTRLVLPEGQNSMYLQLPKPYTNVEPNNVRLLIDGFPSASELVPYGDVQATYVATNPEDNSTAKCSFQVTVDDEEPPKVSRCPGTVMAISTSLEGVPVTWEEPEFSDNVDVESVRSTQSPGSIFNFGVHNVYYTARDIAGNEAVCAFHVNVSRKECRLPADIEHGSTECENWLHGVVCEPSCEDGYALPSNVSLLYTCDLAGVWEPRSWIPNCQAYTPSSATGCLPGSEFFDELDGEANVCVECPAGMYWSQDVGQCFLCEPGFYQDKPAQSSCKPCPAANTTAELSDVLEQQCSS